MCYNSQQQESKTCCNFNCNQGRDCPNRKDSVMQTRKYPRTLNEAFGPYASGPVHDPDEPMHTSDRIVLVASALVALSLFGMVVAGWL